MIKKLILFVLLISTMNVFSVDRKLTIDIKSGSTYTFKYNYGIVLTVIPQIAIWIEDEKGTYIDTVYVTEKTAKASWTGGSSRPQGLPVWSFKRGIKSSNGLYIPDSKSKLPDSMTGATPKSSFTKDWIVPTSVKNGNYVIKVEVNNSFDYNDKYKNKLPKDSQFYNELNGQPSIVWSGNIEIGTKSNEVNLTIQGIGDLTAKSGNISTDLKNITTAKKILESLNVKYY